jgi:hypothetical protein
MTNRCSSQSNDSHHHQQHKSRSKGKRSISEEEEQQQRSDVSSIQSSSLIRHDATPMKISTHSQTMTSENSWMDFMREDQMTTDAWARIRRRLKPEQQKDILR